MTTNQPQPINHYEQQFLTALKNVFIGAKVEGESGYINLMRIKAQYFEQGIFPQLMDEIQTVCQPFDPTFREELFDKLYDFFSRYFSESGSIYFRHTAPHQNIYERVYTDDRDVMLFWKTQMLYYVKTDRLFKSLELELDGQRFFFDVSQMELKRANEKRALIYEWQERDKTGRLVLRVSYSERGSKTKTEELLKAAKEAKVALSEETLEKACRVFEKQSEVDFFINKNAQAFLQEQFDLWLYQYLFKGESHFSAPRVAQLQAIKKMAYHIIDFIAQFEDELVRIWNKPKFVLNSHYVLTLDKMETHPALLQKIFHHAGIHPQYQEWQQLGMLPADAPASAAALYEALSLRDLAGSPAHPRYHFLPLDTRYFPDLELEILSLFDDLDAALDGWLIHSENYQALNTLLPKFHERIKTIYIDPPYNTAASEIAYVNQYKHSSWLSLMKDRLELGQRVLNTEKGFLCCTIDDVEQSVLHQLINQVFGDVVGTVSIRIKPSGRPIPNGFALSHEYAIFARKNPAYPVARLEHSQEQKDRYKERDEKGPFFWELLRKAGSGSSKEDRPTMYFPFLLNTTTGKIRLPKIEFSDSEQGVFRLKEKPLENEGEIYPLKDDGTEGRWYLGYEKAQTIVTELKAEYQDHQYRLYYRRRPNEGVQPATLWFEPQYSATEHGTALLKNLFGEQEIFTYPKSIHAVVDCLKVTGATDTLDGIYLDFFAGSGTTAHAVMNLNRADAGTRKYILIEMGEHFNTVILPRVKKLAFSDKWKDGKANGGQGMSHFVKYFDLEQYEDTLRRAHYADAPLLLTAGNIYSRYIFLRDLKFLETVALNMPDNRVEVDVQRLYAGIDLPETLSCITGKWIKRITADMVEFQDGSTANLHQPDWQTIKPLIWW